METHEIPVIKGGYKKRSKSPRKTRNPRTIRRKSKTIRRKSRTIIRKPRTKRKPRRKSRTIKRKPRRKSRTIKRKPRRKSRTIKRNPRRKSRTIKRNPRKRLRIPTKTRKKSTIPRKKLRKTRKRSRTPIKNPKSLKKIQSLKYKSTKYIRKVFRKKINIEHIIKPTLDKKEYKLVLNKEESPKTINNKTEKKVFCNLEEICKKILHTNNITCKKYIPSYESKITNKISAEPSGIDMAVLCYTDTEKILLIFEIKKSTTDYPVLMLNYNYIKNMNGKYERVHQMNKTKISNISTKCYYISVVNNIDAYIYKYDIIEKQFNKELPIIISKISNKKKEKYERHILIPNKKPEHIIKLIL